MESSVTKYIFHIKMKFAKQGLSFWVYALPTKEWEITLQEHGVPWWKKQSAGIYMQMNSTDENKFTYKQMVYI